MAKEIQARFDAPRKAGRKKKVRPSVAAVYDAALVSRAQKDGNINHKDIAAHFGISVTTWQAWRKEQPEYQQVIDQAKYDDKIEWCAELRRLFFDPTTPASAKVAIAKEYRTWMHADIEATAEQPAQHQTVNILPTEQRGYKPPSFAIIEGIEHETGRPEPAPTRSIGEILRRES